MLVKMVVALLVLVAERATAEYVVYGNGATSERNVPLCGGPREACNVVRQRYWLSPLVHRLCKCPDLTDCPGRWGAQAKQTVAINARAQLKFCSQVGDLEQCNTDTVAAEIRTNGTITIHCFCGRGHFFQKMTNNATGQYYKCLPMGSCSTGEFCGHITVNSYETYHSCTCPPKHICVLQNRNQEYANEFLYQGQTYKGHCLSKEQENNT